MAKVITFIKSGGGVGATTLAVQTACAYRETRIALLDLDIQFGAAAFQMDVESNVSILDLAAASDRLDEALLKGAMVKPDGAFDLLAAPEGVYPLEDLSSAAVGKVIEVARTAYDTVLVDLPTVWNDWSYAALAKSDHIVLVTQMTIPSLRQARRQIEMARRELLGNIPLFVVANRVTSNVFGSSLSQKAAERAIGRPIDFIIPRHDSIGTAAESGCSLGALKAKSLVKKFSNMIDKIVSSTQVPVAAEA
jgi:pilus assembly protein CpaE